MRILFDAIPARFGGVATQVLGLANAWRSTFPADNAEWIISAELSAEDAMTGSAVHIVSIPRPRALWQPVVQTRAILFRTRRNTPDAILALVPQVSLISPGVPEVVFIHDLRHHARPDQFSRLQLLQRWIAYRHAYARAAALVVPSERTRRDVIAELPHLAGKPVFVVPHGCDHVPVRAPPIAPDIAIGFGHTRNKNPRLLIETWAELRRLRSDVPTLTITGCSDATASDLRSFADALRISAHVQILPFLVTETFGELTRRAALVLFPTDYEGFGLPVLEAMRQSIPVVITPEPASLEVAGGHAIVSRDSSAHALAHATMEALSRDANSIRDAKKHSDKFTWAESARRLRSVLAQVSAT